jgi:hypothetical protein
MLNVPDHELPHARRLMRSLFQSVIIGFLCVAPPAPLRAGLYYSGETFADLPSQWRGFLLDQRALRMLAVKPAPGTPTGPLRARYETDAARLTKLAATRALTADEAADLGAIHLRLGEVNKALEVLRPAQRQHPLHFRVAANLGTAWQLHGDADQAAAALQQAVRLAPGKYQRAEELHLKLVRQRRREPRDAQALDDLFGVRFIGPSGKFEPGKMAPEQRKALPADAAALAQQLALWLPADARLLWQLAELANAHGDVAVAAAILDGCVTEFGLRHPELLDQRRAARAAAEGLARSGDRPDKAAHEGHAGLLKTRSSRPLPVKVEPAALPPIDTKGVNALPWAVVLETVLDSRYRPTFPRYLKEVAGKRVQLVGYMQPLGEGSEVNSFLLIENPVGCWYCEMPELPGMMLIELPPSKLRAVTRGPLRVTGRLALNAGEPERFLYTLEEATAVDAE